MKFNIGDIVFLSNLPYVELIEGRGYTYSVYRNRLARIEGFVNSNTVTVEILAIKTRVNLSVNCLIKSEKK